MPKEKYSFAPEIYEHSQRIAKHFGLYDIACFQTRVTELRWDEAERALDRLDGPRRRDAARASS